MSHIWLPFIRLFIRCDWCLKCCSRQSIADVGCCNYCFCPEEIRQFCKGNHCSRWLHSFSQLLHSVEVNEGLHVSSCRIPFALRYFSNSPVLSVYKVPMLHPFLLVTDFSNSLNISNFFDFYLTRYTLQKREKSSMNVMKYFFPLIDLVFIGQQTSLCTSCSRLLDWIFPSALNGFLCISPCTHPSQNDRLYTRHRNFNSFC